jgi:hypothetical protein
VEAGTGCCAEATLQAIAIAMKKNKDFLKIIEAV